MKQMQIIFISCKTQAEKSYTHRLRETSKQASQVPD